MVVAVHGVSSLEISEGHTFPFSTDSPMEEIWATLEAKILERYPYSENQSLVEVNFDEDVRAVSRLIQILLSMKRQKRMRVFVSCSINFYYERIDAKYSSCCFDLNESV